MDGSVRGRVKRGDGAAVAGATVFIMKGPGPAPDIASVSDDAGSFVLDGLAEGTYVLRAVGPAQETGETPVIIHASRVTDAEIVLTKP
jgi:hypothetical protein